MTGPLRARAGGRAPWAGSLVVWALLMALFALTLWLAYRPMNGWNGTASMVIAAAKALLVALVFMRLRAGPAILVLAALAGLFWLGTLFALTFTDYPLRQAGETIASAPSGRVFDAARDPPAP